MGKSENWRDASRRRRSMRARISGRTHPRKRLPPMPSSSPNLSKATNNVAAMVSFQRSLEGFLSWRCGYATGLRAALQMMRDCKDPQSRLEREFASATAEARTLWTDVGRPTMERN